ncbi:MAG: DUF1499 domain-containing protein [Pseudomonadales bacterium]|nr:DUF1499 domain-containing protein [Pseudomonadales bacterium]MDP4640074.1 DUF1499 domain-containing protein [Pseudomonadales bacterium]MDP4875030.1 DUF1499 domain-containing protein [Pseudomonadales bacterium]MDP4910782.1 DUF1499 domain-containing protein [Pseudomonadales bacterium]
MEETKWWSKFCLVSAVLALVLLLAGPLGYKYGIAELMPSFAALILALVMGLLVLVAGLVLLVVAARKNLRQDRNLLLVAVLCSVVPVIAMAPALLKARSVPAIHDITTDTTEPPVFDVAVGLRGKAPNELTYGAGQASPEALAKLQLAAYPQLKSLQSSLSPAEAVARAALVLAEQGLEVVNTDVENGRVEAVATSFWFGFKDDLVVRVQATPSGSRIDVRSVSRVGQSDLGANAARIEKFLTAFGG